MNVYDFDKTIYRYDSAKKFFLFCLFNTPKVWLTLPYQVAYLCLYLTGMFKTKRYKAMFFSFLKKLPDIDRTLDQFWQKEAVNIKDWYLKQAKTSDVVISASPAFLVQPICKKLGIKTVIATKMDKHTGVITGENCKGKEKVERFNQMLPNAEIDEFYSDSLSDSPLAERAIKAVWVKKDKRMPWPSVF